MVVITGKDFQLTEPIKQYVLERAKKLERRHDRIITMKFELDVDRRIRRAIDARRKQHAIAAEREILAARAAYRAEFQSSGSAWFAAQAAHEWLSEHAR